MKDYYQILGVKPEDSQSRIKEVYRKLAGIYHPDAGGGASGEEKLKEINEAYRVLGKTESRAKYDIAWRLEQNRSSSNEPDRDHESNSPPSGGGNPGTSKSGYGQAGTASVVGSQTKGGLDPLRLLKCILAGFMMFFGLIYALPVVIFIYILVAIIAGIFMTPWLGWLMTHTMWTLFTLVMFLWPFPLGFYWEYTGQI